MTPRRLTSITAYNSAGVSTVSPSCAGQPTKTVTLGAGQVTTISTEWTATCGSVTVASTAGWDTTFDDLTFD